MSQELRTPLNASLGFGQLLEMDELGSGQQESVKRSIQSLPPVRQCHNREDLRGTRDAR
jgi:signal transduction histidine kinase